tara:strand:+ start:160 stop:291 length:132 start_codon:yes stop_codon:yes gene_type:complete
MPYIEGQFPQDVSLEDIFNLDDDEIVINFYYDEDVVIDLLNKI